MLCVRRDYTMKYSPNFLLVAAFFFLGPLSLFSREPLKVYFSAKVKPEQQDINKNLLARFFSTKNSRVFLPQDHINLTLKNNEDNNQSAYQMDKEAINWCDILFLVSPYGKDSSWTVGYAEATGKFTVVYLTEASSIEDILVMNSADIIATEDPEVYKKLSEHKSLSKKSLFIFEKDNFEEVMICMLYANKAKQTRFLENATKYKQLHVTAQK